MAEATVENLCDDNIAIDDIHTTYKWVLYKIQPNKFHAHETYNLMFTEPSFFKSFEHIMNHFSPNDDKCKALNDLFNPTLLASKKYSKVMDGLRLAYNAWLSANGTVREKFGDPSIYGDTIDEIKQKLNEKHITSINVDNMEIVDI